MIAIGGGHAVGDEVIAARALNIPVTFIPADMNHALAVENAKKNALPVRSEFKGAADIAMDKSGFKTASCFKNLVGVLRALSSETRK